MYLAQGAIISLDLGKGHIIDKDTSDDLKEKIQRTIRKCRRRIPLFFSRTCQSDRRTHRLQRRTCIPMRPDSRYLRCRKKTE